MDPQYHEFPSNLTAEDRHRYFEPIVLTNAMSGAVDWLKPYVPKGKHSVNKQSVGENEQAVALEAST